MNTVKLNVRKGLERLARVYCWPNDPTITDMDKYEFKVLREFIFFNVFVKNAFFTILHAGLRNQTANLYRHLLSSLKEDTPMLTFKEAFLLFRLIGNKQTRSILDTISCPPSTYNGILESIDNLEYESFVLSFRNYDNKQMFQVLWQMRYILYGTNSAWELSGPTEQLSSSRFNEWSRSKDNYQSYFCEIPEKCEDNFVRQKVLAIVGYEDSSKKKVRIRCPKHSLFDEYINYSEKVSGKSLFYSQWKDLLAEFNANSDLPVRNSRVNTSYIEDLAQLILTHNVILHKDYIMEKYGIDSSDIYNQFRNTDVYTYEDGDSKDFGRYILYYTWEMLHIFNKVENILDDDSKKVLKSILYSSKYTELIDSFASSSLLQKMAAPKKPENETSNENVETINDNAIVLSTHPFLSVDYKDKFCKAISTLSANCNPQMVEYFFWGTSKDPDKAISKSNPLIFISDKQRFTAYVRVAYINRNVPKNVIDDLNSAVMVNNKSYKYKSIGLNVPIFSRIIDEIKTEIGWIEKNKR